MATATAEIERPKVVSPAEWLATRKDFLKKEKEFTRLRDELSRQRRELPWEKVDKRYAFDGPNGQLPLTDLFGSRSQLVVYHFMLGPGWKEGCPHRIAPDAETLRGAVEAISSQEAHSRAGSSVFSPISTEKSRSQKSKVLQ